MRKTSKGGATIGTSSILVIFIILCLVTFATLSLVSARADYTLSERAAKSTKEYYTACNTAQDLLLGIDAVLAQSFASTNTKTQYIADVFVQSQKSVATEQYYKDDVLYISFKTDATDRKKLFCELKILYPEKDSDQFYKITQWKLVDEGSWQPNDELPVYTGNSGATHTGGLPQR